MHHGFKVEKFATECNEGLLEWITPFLDALSDLVWKINCNWMREYTIGTFSFALIVSTHGHVLEIKKVIVNLHVICIEFVVIGGKFSELLLVFLYIVN